MSEDISSNNNINIIGESSKSQLDEFFRNNQATIEKGLETSFKTLNNSLYSIINTAFATFANDYEKRLDKNREVHEKAVEGLTQNLKKSKNIVDSEDSKKKEQEKILIKTFQDAQNLKKKSQIFRRLNKYVFEKKKKHLKDDIITDFLLNRRKNLIFNSWRNIINSQQKAKIRLKYSEQYHNKYEQMKKDFNEEMEKLKNVLENLQIDIQKEIEERKALSKLYDLSLKKGVEAFLRETNYIVDLNTDNVPTPMERSYAESMEREKKK